MRYRTRENRILIVVGRKVTDKVPGIELPNTAGVREHVRLGRLIEVAGAAKSKPEVVADRGAEPKKAPKSTRKVKE